MWCERVWQYVKRQSLWLTLPCLFIGGGVLGFLLMYFTQWASALGAAWVQAVGSVAAIFIAILVPYIQKKNDDRIRKHEAIKNRLNANRAACSLMRGQLDLMERLVDTGFGWRPRLSEREQSALVNDLQSNKAMTEQLAADTLGLELLSYLVLVKKTAVFGGYFAECIEDRCSRNRVSDLRAFGIEVSSIVGSLRDAIDEIEKLSADIQKSNYF